MSRQLSCLEFTHLFPLMHPKSAYAPKSAEARPTPLFSDSLVIHPINPYLLSIHLIRSDANPTHIRRKPDGLATHLVHFVQVPCPDDHISTRHLSDPEPEGTRVLPFYITHQTAPAPIAPRLLHPTPIDPPGNLSPDCTRCCQLESMR